MTVALFEPLLPVLTTGFVCVFFSIESA